MPVMSRVEQAFCRSAPWRSFSRRTVVPWAVEDPIHGEVLELGSGSGEMASDLLDRYPISRLVATDLDPTMVAAAGQRLARFGPRVEVRHADATGLPFDDDTFDAVVSFLMLHHIIEWEVAVHEVFRVLRPGGRFIGYDLGDTGFARLIHRLDGSPHRLVTPDQLRSRFGTANAHRISVAPSWSGLVFRFDATKPDDTSSGPGTDAGRNA